MSPTVSPPDFSNAFRLSEAIEQSGFGDVEYPRQDFPMGGVSNEERVWYHAGYRCLLFTTFGSVSLRDNLHAAINRRNNPSIQFNDVALAKAREDVDTAQNAIKSERRAIAEKIYFEDYPFSVRDATNRGDGSSSFTLEISTGNIHPNVGAVLFSTQDFGTVFNNQSFAGPMSFTVVGNTSSIGEFVNTHRNYRARVWFSGFRPPGHSAAAAPYFVNSANRASADVLGIAIYSTRQQPPTTPTR